MQTPPRMLVLVLGLALLIGTASALMFNATVENNVGTRLVNTHVQVLVGNTTLYEKAAIWCPKIDPANGCPSVVDRAVAQFTLAPGIYFIRLQRGGYPNHVYLLNLTQDIEVKYVMFIQKSTYTLFGQVTVDPDYWAGRKISLIDQQDTVVRSVMVMPGGDFLVDSVWPGTPYQLRLDDGTQRILSPVFTAPDTGAGYMEVNGGLAASNNTVLAPKLSASSNAALYAILSVQLKAGERPMVGQPVLVSTPRGTMNLSTDANGKAYVQAAEGGDYTFTWETQVVKMSVPKQAAPPAPANNENQTAGGGTAPASGNETNGQGNFPSGGQPNAGESAILGGAGILLIAAVVVIAVVFIFVVAPWLMKMANKPAEKKEGKEEPVAPMWPKPAEPSMESGGAEHAHKEHANAHPKHKEAQKHNKKKH